MTASRTRKKPDAALARHLAQALPVATRAAIEAGEFIHSRFGRFRKLTSKPDTSLVTEVDKGSEKIVVGRLRKAFPNDNILGEEGGLSQGQRVSDFRWHVDPLDGTTNFVHGFPFFCVSIGLEYERDDLVLGVIYQPITKDLYLARRGKGATRNGKRMQVSKTARLRDGLLSTGFSMRHDKFFSDEIASFAAITLASHAVRRTGSAALDLVHVATGQFDAFWERGLSSWDVAAGLTLVAEAGGDYSRMDGKAFQIGDDSVLASNGRLHKELLSIAAR
ncbi:MAG: inositol monophosphatase [Deltaproteobacteria bacterium]|nr:inositol monophosphatase [Deltaproteobacteria bacterium]